MNILTIGKLIFRISIIIAVVELFIMLILGYIPHEMEGENMLISGLVFLSISNALLLVIFTSPLIYFWVVKPFIDERDVAIAKISSLAHYDELTNLANRRLINQNLKILLAQCIRREIYGALVMIDLDNFKPINDNYGHDAGDAILVEIANRLTSTMRDEDVAGRIGGDEFVILIDFLDKNKQIATEKVLQLSERFHDIIKQPLEYAGEILSVGSSIGVAFLGPEDITIETAYKRADIAMYKAKESNGKYIVFSE
tara:strand:- start:4406 stop:5170 length:765 start_codon:yes stop_codon:yes gene_type:complete